MKGTVLGMICVAMVMSAVLGVAPIHAQIPEGYEMVRLTGFGIQSRPDINNRSEVIWGESQPPSVADIYLFSGGIVRKLTDDTYYDVRPRINDHGDYAYMVAPDFFGTFDIAVNIGGELTIIDAMDAVNGHPDINNTGQVVWEDKFTEDASDERVFLFDNQVIEQITFNGLCNHSPRINKCGQVVIDAGDTTKIGNPSAILAYENGLLVSLTDNSKLRSGPINNDHGQIVWHESDLDGLNDRIMLWDTGTATSVIDQDGVEGPSVNNNGDITYDAWNASLQLSNLWFYRASDLTPFLLPTLGLSADGRVGMNDCGELAWRALELDRGQTTLLLMRRIGPLGDFDHDCRVDAYDFSILEDCFTGSGAGPSGGLLADCVRADFDGDGDVDQADVNAFKAAAGGPTMPVPNCQAVEMCGL